MTEGIFAIEKIPLTLTKAKLELSSSDFPNTRPGD